MKSLITSLLVCLFAASTAFAGDRPELMSHSVQGDEVELKFFYEKATHDFLIFGAIQIPYKHVWSQTVECAKNADGGAKATVTVSYELTRAQVQGTTTAVKKMNLDLTELCAGERIQSLVVNGRNVL